MTAILRRSGIISRKSSHRLLTSSVDCIDRPVTLPPGRANDANRVRSCRKDDRDGRCKLLQGGNRKSDCNDDINLEAHELCPDLSVSVAAALRPPIFDFDRASFDPA